MIRISLVLFYVLFPLTIVAQQNTYSSPVNFPISLSGNVGEIRGNHFHSGLDIRAAKGIGSPVFAVMDGYVSRVFVSPYGFGHALYITNIDGTTAVYGHLDRFVNKIQSWSEKRQYDLKSFSVDLYPVRGQFPVKKGECVAYLGNSGSSGGPHLHFEIRNAQSGNPMNLGAKKLYSIQDNIAPIVYRIHAFEQDTVMGVPIFKYSSTINLTANKSGVFELTDSVLRVSSPLYLAYECVDKKNGSNFTMGIYSMVQKVDGMVNFSYAIQDVAFATTRYANSLAQYSMTIKTRNDVIRAYVSPNNLLKIYKTVENSGVIVPPLKGGQRKKINTTLIDDNGNEKTVEFYIERVNRSKPKRLLTNIENVVDFATNYNFSDNVMSVFIPSKSLYETAILSFQKVGNKYVIGDSEIPLHGYITVKTKDNNIEPSLRTKALFVGSNGGSVGGEWKDGQMEFRTRNFGSFRVAYDTIAPLIMQQKIGAGNILKFKITDNLSGIAHYKLTVDGEWALAKYDPKTSSLSYTFKRSEEGSKDRKIVLEVSDGKGNKKIYRAIEKW